MSKELEALRVLKANAILFDDGTDFGASMLEAISELDKALTPPTADEVCKALSKELKRPVKFDGDNFYYIVQRQYYGECDEIICGWSYSPKELSFEKDLPPHLITLIGLFYEGLEEK